MLCLFCSKTLAHPTPTKSIEIDTSCSIEALAVDNDRGLAAKTSGRALCDVVGDVHVTPRKTVVRGRTQECLPKRRIRRWSWDRKSTKPARSRECQTSRMDQCGLMHRHILSSVFSHVFTSCHNSHLLGKFWCSFSPVAPFLHALSLASSKALHHEIPSLPALTEKKSTQNFTQHHEQFHLSTNVRNHFPFHSLQSGSDRPQTRPLGLQQIGHSFRISFVGISLLHTMLGASVSPPQTISAVRQ